MTSFSIRSSQCISLYDFRRCIQPQYFYVWEDKRISITHNIFYWKKNGMFLSNKWR